MKRITVDVTGILPRLPQPVIDKIRELVREGRVVFKGLCIKSGQTVAITLEVPLTELAAEIADALEAYSRSKK
jgi:hypothetical protein